MSGSAGGKTPRRRHLTQADEEVWRLVTRTLKPLKKTQARVTPAPDKPAPVAAPPARIAHAPLPAPAPAPKLKAAPRMQPVEDKLKRRLARGRLKPDMKLDLHGMRQHEAHDALRAFIRRAQAQGARLVTVVTGKGRGVSAREPEPGDFTSRPGGVLQRMARHWLAAPDLRDAVIGYDEADAAHGGSGALYVRIRRDREGSQSI